MSIHKEGTGTLIISFLLFGVINYLQYNYIAEPALNSLILITTIGLFLFLLQFFRNPIRNINYTENGVLAPADGKVVVIEKTREEEYLNEERIQVSIFMSPLNVHSNRSPVDGTISYQKYHPGKYLVAWHPKSSTENERTSIVFQLSNNVEIMLRQIAGAMARRIKFYTEEGKEYKQGEEFGFIKFGSRVDLYLPLDSEILVKPGDIVRSGKSLIARLSKN